MTSFARVARGGIALLALTLPLSRAHAQSLAQQTRRLVVNSDGPSHVLSVNPFLPLLGYFAGEYEQRIAPNVSVAVAGSHTKFDDTRRTNLDAKVRLYPSERGLQGLGVAAALGVARLKDERSDVCSSFDNFDPFCGPNGKEFTTATFAIEASYQYLLGPSRSTAITVGGGAKRYLGNDNHYQNILRVVPTLRLTIGYAF